MLTQSPPEHPWSGVWSFHVVPTGTSPCRLLSRSRTEVFLQLGLRLATRIGEPITLVLTLRMLRGVLTRDEARRSAYQPVAVMPVAKAPGYLGKLAPGVAQPVRRLGARRRS